jgi:hypothetical protein
MTLEQLFNSLDSQSWRQGIFIPDGRPNLKTPVILHDPDDTPSGSSLPLPLADAGFRQALSVADLRDIRENARLQGRTPTATKPLEAYAFYLDNDAFIDWGGAQPVD